MENYSHVANILSKTGEKRVHILDYNNNNNIII